MTFTRNNKNAFHGIYSLFPFLLAFMKITAGLLTESMNILIIVQSQTIEGCIKDFIAFGFISEIDNMMMKTITSIDGPFEIEDSGIAYPKKQLLTHTCVTLNQIWYLDNNSIAWKLTETI